MRRSFLLKPFLIFLGILAGHSLRAQTADSLKHRLSALLVQYKARLLKDTDYLRCVDSIAPLLESDDSLPEALSTYRQIAFGDPKQGRRRANYYTYLALNAYNANKWGTAIYYSEKNNEERVNAGLFEKGELAHSDLFALSLYYNNRDYPRVIMKLLTLNPALGRIPPAISAGKAGPEQVFLALSILETAVYTYARTGDTPARLTAFRLAETIQQEVRAAPGKYTRFIPQYNYLQHSTAYRNEQAQGHSEQARKLLLAAITDVEGPDFPKNLKADYSVSLYTEAVDFYFDRNQVDSARHYLDILHGHGTNALFAVTDPGFLLISDSRLLAGEKKYAEAYSSLRKAWLLRDSAFYTVSSDRDNNLYALAEAENTRAELFRSEESKRAAQQSNLLLFFILSILVLGGISIFIVYRAQQQQRLLNLQLHLARNFHDTVGPMLLYANALVKKEAEQRPSEGLDELKGQIGQIMEAVRSISHDLKTNRLGTLNTLGKELTTLLEKIRDATGIAFTLTVDNGQLVLSHFQKTHLSKIIQELITNSVKHSACSRISLAIKGQPRNLQLSYSDDGKGMDPAVPTTGIGLANIRERVDSLQGRLELVNDFPKGYSIALSIPLL
ncbi:MAG TPA: ATP-binding protein [Puia sp.]|nr:ATP-binding protein [Puia sp.]